MLSVRLAMSVALWGWNVAPFVPTSREKHRPTSSQQRRRPSSSTITWFSSLVVKRVSNFAPCVCVCLCVCVCVAFGFVYACVNFWLYLRRSLCTDQKHRRSIVTSPVNPGVLRGGGAGRAPAGADPRVGRLLLPPGAVPRLDAVALLVAVQVLARPQGRVGVGPTPAAAATAIDCGCSRLRRSGVDPA